MVPPFNETWAAMEELVDRGLVKSIGVSNFSPEKIKAILEHARIRPAVNQVSQHDLLLTTISFGKQNQQTISRIQYTLN